MQQLLKLLALVCFFTGATFAATTTSTPYAGVTRYSADNVTVNGRSVDYEVVVINTLDAGISFYLTPDNGAANYETVRQTTKNFASAYATEVAINAHFFDTGLSPNTDNTGIAASNGTVYSPFENVGGLAALNIHADNFPETVTGIYSGTTFASSPVPPFTAINPGSMLIRDGAVLNTGAEDFRARSQIGVSRNGAVMMLFASSSGMTEQEGATILVGQFGAFHVHGLDGGGSTTLVLRTGASTQTIIAKEGFTERAVGTNLGVQAADYVAGIPDTMSWDAAPGTAGIQQGAGVWDVVTNNWQASGTNRTWANPKTPVLGAGGGAAITLGSRIGVQNMTVGGGYTIGTTSGSSFTILGNFTTTGAQPTTINAPLGSSSSFTKLGGQTLILGGSSRISQLTMAEGVIDLSGQTLAIIDPLVPLVLTGGTMQNGAVVLEDSAPDFFVPSGVTTISADFTTPKLTKSGSGAVYLTGSNAWGTPLVVSSGTLGFGPGAVVPGTAVTVSSGGLDLNGANVAITTLGLGGVPGAGTTVSTGTGVLTLGGSLTVSGTGLGAVVTGNVGLGATRTFVVGDSLAADDLVVSANLSGAFTLTKTGSGTLVLSGSNTFSAFTQSSGTTRLAASEVLPGGTLTVSAGLLDLAGFDETVGALTMGGVAATTAEVRTGGGLLTLGGNYTYSATANGNGAVLTGRLSLGNATRTFAIGDSTNATVDARIEAPIEGGAGMTKTGSGRLDLAGALSFPGTFTVSSGEVRLSGSDSMLGAITLGGVANQGAILDTGTTTLSGTGTLAHSSNSNGLGGILRGRFNLGSALRTLTINNSTNADPDLRIEAGLSGSGGFTKGGTGTLELAGNNTLNGPITATAGVLRLAHASALGNAPTLTFNGTASLDAGGLSNSTLLINRADLTVSGIGTLTGNVELSAGKLTCPGTGVLAITGNLNLTSGTTAVKVGTGAGTITSGGSVALGGTLVVTMGGTLSGTQSIPIISGTAVSGNFSSIQLPAPPNGSFYFVTVTGTQVLFQVAPATPSQSWLAGQGLYGGTEMDMDTDGDGQALLAEYALGGSANGSDEALSSANGSGAALQLLFSRNATATDVTYVVEGTATFASWETLLTKSGSGAWTGAAGFSEGTLSGGLVPVTVTDTTTTRPRFMRVRITKP